MCTIFTHALVGAAILRIGSPPAPFPKRAWALAALLAAAPDLDAIGFWLGIPYDSMLGHRGLTHSLPFSLLLGAAALLAFSDRAPTPPSRPLPISTRRLFLLFSLAAASHGLLDMLTDGGLGIALFSPFSNHRFFFPSTPIAVSPLSPAAFFSNWGLHVLWNELLWVLLPTTAAVLLHRLTPRHRSPP